MTLLELLRQELPKRGGWPVNITSIVQDGDGHLCFKSSPEMPRYNESRKEWEIPGHHREDWNGGESCRQISDDHATAIVTREQYGWDDEGAGRSACFVPGCLRPLRTEAERAIDEMVQLSGVSTGAAKILYDAGYRKG